MSLVDLKKILHIASDHAGLTHKNELVLWLKENGYQVIDHGALEYNAEDDFPDFISLVAEAVSTNPENSLGIIFGGSGQGEAIIANRYPNVRAIVFYGGPQAIIELSRTHNDANVISFGARFVTVEEVKAGVLLWLKTAPLTEEKYQRRNQKIEAITNRIKKI